MNLEKYLRQRTESKKGKYRTVNLDEELHIFLKRTANHYDISIADLVFNIVSNWKSQHEKEINSDIRRLYN